MEDDPLSPVAPARIRCLVLPCGRIRRSRFLEFLRRLRQAGIVRLGDISPDGRPHRTMFSPLAFPTGLILYELSTSIPPPSHLALAPFELYREPLAVVAIADGKDYNGGPASGSPFPDNRDILEARGDRNTKEDIDNLLESVISLKDQYPTSLVHQVFIFDHDGQGAILPPSLVPVPSPEKSRTTTMKTIMCDLTSLILAEMTSYAKSLQALQKIETPKQLQVELMPTDYFSSQDSQTDGSRPSSRLSDSQTPRSRSPSRGIEKSLHRMSTPAHVSMPEAPGPSNPGSRPTTPVNGLRTPDVKSDGLNAVSERAASPIGKETMRPASRDRVSIPGFGPGSVGERERNKAKGRIGLVVGSMYLLAGRWPDAVRELVESATLAKANSDHVWHAKALDYVLVCVLMYAWAGMDFEIPQILYTVGDKSNSALGKSSKHPFSNSTPDLPSSRSPNAANRLVSLQNLTNLLPDLVNNILHLYVRAATFTSDQIPQVAFSESTIRFARLLAIIETSHGSLDDQALQQVVLNRNVARKDNPMATKLTPFPSKSEITALLFRAFPSSRAETSISTADRITVLAGIASVLSILGYHRKKAFVLRELMAVLLPALVQSRKDGAAEMGVHPAASLSSFDLSGRGLGHQEPASSRGDFEHGIQSFLAFVCQVYGIVLSAPTGPNSDRDHHGQVEHADSGGQKSVYFDSLDAITARVVQHATTRSFGGYTLKLDILRSCINICEALPDLEGILRFSSDLLRTAGSGIAPGPESTEGSPKLSVDDQVRLANNISRTINAAKQLGLEKLEADYWDDFLIREVGVIDAASSKAVHPHAKAVLEIAGKTGTEEEKGPFIYNPFVAKSNSTVPERLLVAGQEVEFRVTLQNLFDFDIEVEWLRLQTNNVAVESTVQGMMIGPYRTQTMQLLGTPTGPGSLEIMGCLVKIKGCRERRFPIFSIPWTNKQDPKVKHIGLSAATGTPQRPSSVVSDSGKSQNRSKANLPAASTVTLTVINAQPDVVVRATTLSQSAIMLLEGETKRFSVTLHNISKSLPVDLLLLSFTDSTSSSMQSPATKRELSPAELHELEFSSSHRQALRWRRAANDADPSIAPRGDIALEIEVFGKPGLSYGTIQIDYGYLGMPKTEVKDRFYTRRVVVPLTITVNASADLVRNDLLPFSSDFAWLNQQRQHLPNGSAESTPPHDQRRRAGSRVTPKGENRFQSLLKRLGLGTYGEDHCLLLLDLHNAWPNPLSITVQVRETLNKDPSPGGADSWKRAYSVHEVLQPGHTSRLVLLLPRIFLHNPYAPIPSLNPAHRRQYVVSTSKVSPDVERTSREVFWYREEVLKHIRASWEEDSTGRNGEIELRGLRLTNRMVDALKLEDLAIEMTLAPAVDEAEDEQDDDDNNNINNTNPTPPVHQTARSKFTVPTDTFLVLKTRLTNRSPHPIHPLLRLQPSLRNLPYNVALDLAKKFAFNGLLQQTLPPLMPGGVSEVELGCCFLCGGEFEIHAEVEEVRVWNGAPVSATATATASGLEGEEGGGGGSGAEAGARARADSGDLMGGNVLERDERRIWHAREPCIVYAQDEEHEVLL